jgi:hypothetical protein
MQHDQWGGGGITYSHACMAAMLASWSRVASRVALLRGVLPLLRGVLRRVALLRRVLALRGRQSAYHTAKAVLRGIALWCKVNNTTWLHAYTSEHLRVQDPCCVTCTGDLGHEDSLKSTWMQNDLARLLRDTASIYARWRHFGRVRAGRH